MKTTEKKYWKNGRQKRGGYFNTFNFSIFNLGVMFTWIIDKEPKRIEIDFFKLIN